MKKRRLMKKQPCGGYSDWNFSMEAGERRYDATQNKMFDLYVNSGKNARDAGELSVREPQCQINGEESTLDKIVDRLHILTGVYNDIATINRHVDEQIKKIEAQVLDIDMGCRKLAEIDFSEVEK